MATPQLDSGRTFYSRSFGHRGIIRSVKGEMQMTKISCFSESDRLPCRSYGKEASDNMMAEQHPMTVYWYNAIRNPTGGAKRSSWHTPPQWSCSNGENKAVRCSDQARTFHLITRDKKWMRTSAAPITDNGLRWKHNYTGLWKCAWVCLVVAGYHRTSGALEVGGCRELSMSGGLEQTLSVPAETRPAIAYSTGTALSGVRLCISLLRVLDLNGFPTRPLDLERLVWCSGLTLGCLVPQVGLAKNRHTVPPNYTSDGRIAAVTQLLRIPSRTLT
ncbi:hypothetical protein BDW22DRAFT_1342171 [Trametopsis cervina]|nr:hypothetical protein BDW22DRAFT_1342171 [Trametopsis cervina]